MTGEAARAVRERFRSPLLVRQEEREHMPNWLLQDPQDEETYAGTNDEALARILAETPRMLDILLEIQGEVDLGGVRLPRDIQEKIQDLLRDLDRIGESAQ